MAKVPDDQRTLEILRRRGEDISDDWAWIKRYLELAEKCLKPGNKSAPEEAGEEGSDPTNDQRSAEADAIDAGDAEAAQTESKPQARKQSA